jgi:hypothetical protein
LVIQDCVTNGLAKFFDREACRAAQPYEILPPLPDFTRRGGNFVSNFERDRLNSMAVTVNQIARLNFQASHLDCPAEIEDVGVRM